MKYTALTGIPSHTTFHLFNFFFLFTSLAIRPEGPGYGLPRCVRAVETLFRQYVQECQPVTGWRRPQKTKVVGKKLWAKTQARGMPSSSKNLPEQASAGQFFIVSIFSSASWMSAVTFPLVFKTESFTS